ncbi:polysaccharide pyruvyl transferase family protein [Synechococcus elongatus]|uniref:polysaccharide pyruvyl transferase family protein n=1 Tax=Synechococcus elongatus TaxID=32046 RepID=UPI0030D32CC0
MSTHSKKLIPVFIVNDTSADSHYGCYAVMNTIKFLAQKNNLDIVGYWPVHKEWYNNQTFNEKLLSSHLVIINGEGTIHDDLKSASALLELASYAKNLGRPTALINTGWERMSPNYGELLSNFELVSARDTASAERIRKYKNDVRTVPDLSIVSCMMIPEINVLRKSIGITDSVLTEKSLELFKLKKSLDAKLVSIFDKKKSTLLQFIRKGTSIKNGLMNPLEAIKSIQMRGELWSLSHSSLDEFIYDLSTLELLVSGRFHACTLSLITQTPFLAIESNTSKISSLIHDAQLENWRLVKNINKLHCHERGLYGWSLREAKNIRNYTLEAIFSAQKLFLDLRKLADQ